MKKFKKIHPGFVSHFILLHVYYSCLNKWLTWVGATLSKSLCQLIQVVFHVRNHFTKKLYSIIYCINLDMAKYSKLKHYMGRHTPQCTGT